MFNKSRKKERASHLALPPRFAKLLFCKLLLEDEKNEKLGDFEEVFRYMAEQRGVFKARVWYGTQILKAIPACLENIIYWRCMMIRNYLKTALRNMRKSKAISFINIFGLSIGIAFFILVFLFVSNEYSHDRFHKNHKSIYRILSEHKFDNQQRVGS